MSNYDLETSLPIAATHLNLLPIVRDAVDPLLERRDATIWRFRGTAFGDPYLVATQQNNHQILEFLLRKKLE